MYNFNAHALNGVAVSYSSLPNFALDIIERDERLTLASKMIYIRLLRYASMVKDTAFKITGSWLVEQLAMNRHTVSRSLAQLKQCGYVTDKGLVIPSTEKAKTIENEQVQTQEKVSEMISGLLNLVGSRKAKTATNDVKTPVQNVPHDVAKSNTTEKTMSQFAPSNVAKSTTACCKSDLPLRIKKRIKKRIMGMNLKAIRLTCQCLTLLAVRVW